MADTPWAGFTDQNYVDPANSFLAETASGSGAGVNIPGSAFVVKNSAGKYGAGVTSPLAFFHINGTVSNPGGATPNGMLLLSDTASTGVSLEMGVSGTVATTWLQTRAFNSASYYELALNPAGGQVLVGTTSKGADGAKLRIQNVNSAEWSSATLELVTSAGAKNVMVYNGGNNSWNASAAVMLVAKNTSTNRSIAASGTGNFSGSDYAEYLRKAVAHIEASFLKGEVLGIDSDGNLTPKWSEAHSFVIKSYDPSIVGGDTWDRRLPPKPEVPEAIGPAPILPPSPAPFDVAMPERAEGEGDQAFTVRMADWLIHSRAAAEELAAYSAAAAGYPDALEQWTEQKAAHDAARAVYDTGLPLWQAAHDEARSLVDRIAFSGQVPVIVEGQAEPGQYLVAFAGDDDSILCRARDWIEIISDPERLLETRIVGKIWAIREVKLDPADESATPAMVTRAWANVLHR